jgi:branched-chain amino acid transport system permease protein
MDYSFLLTQALVSGILMGGIYALVGVSLTMIFGVLKIINFCHGTLVMLGMYVAYWVFVLFGISPYVSFIISGITLFLVGMVIQRFFLDRVLNSSADIQLLLTLGIGLFLDNLAQVLFTSNFRTISLPYTDTNLELGNIMISVTRLIAFIIALILPAVLFFLLKKTDFGRAIRAVSDEQKEGALYVGINVKRIYHLAYAIGAACAGMAGALILPFFYVSPSVGQSYVIIAFVIVVLGGMGNFYGALMGGLIVGVAESFSAVLLPGSLKEFGIYVIFTLVLLFKPSGIFGGKSA